jgi:hypothetical protein
VALDSVGDEQEVAALAVGAAVRRAFRFGHDKVDRLVCVCVCNLLILRAVLQHHPPAPAPIAQCG